MFLFSYLPRRPYGVSVGQGSPPSGSLAVLNRSLFKSSFIQAQKQHQQSLPVFDLAETEIWRSETLLQVLFTAFCFRQIPPTSTCQQTLYQAHNTCHYAAHVIKYHTRHRTLVIRQRVARHQTVPNTTLYQILDITRPRNTYHQAA